MTKNDKRPAAMLVTILLGTIFCYIMFINSMADKQAEVEAELEEKYDSAQNSTHDDSTYGSQTVNIGFGMTTVSVFLDSIEDARNAALFYPQRDTTGINFCSAFLGGQGGRELIELTCAGTLTVRDSLQAILLLLKTIGRQAVTNEKGVVMISNEGDTTHYRLGDTIRYTTCAAPAASQYAKK